MCTQTSHGRRIRRCKPITVTNLYTYIQKHGHRAGQAVYAGCTVDCAEVAVEWLIGRRPALMCKLWEAGPCFPAAATFCADLFTGQRQGASTGRKGAGGQTRASAIEQKHICKARPHKRLSRVTAMDKQRRWSGRRRCAAVHLPPVRVFSNTKTEGAAARTRGGLRPVCMA
jgi:hypothetical protein